MRLLCVSHSRHRSFNVFYYDFHASEVTFAIKRRYAHFIKCVRCWSCSLSQTSHNSVNCRSCLACFKHLLYPRLFFLGISYFRRSVGLYHYLRLSPFSLLSLLFVSTLLLCICY